MSDLQVLKPPTSSQGLLEVGGVLAALMPDLPPYPRASSSPPPSPVPSVCQDRKWNCTDRVCDAGCSAVGLAHYFTFDGLKYLFPGECQYVLVQVRPRGAVSQARAACGNSSGGWFLRE